VNISNLPPPAASTPQGLGVDDFRHGARLGEAVRVQVDGDSFKLVANGQTPSGRSVAWVEGDADATRMFVGALEGAFGGKLSHAIAKELDLHSAPGAALQSNKIDQALTMAETASGALAGVQFAEQLPGKVSRSSG